MIVIISSFSLSMEFRTKTEQLFTVEELLSVLIAIAMLHITYKATFDSRPSNNSSWDLMKEILLTKVSFKNEVIDYQVIECLNDYDCERNYCQESVVTQFLSLLSLRYLYFN